MRLSGQALRILLIDLDDTVYPTDCGLMKEVGRLILRYMVERMGIPPEEAVVLRRQYYLQYGTTLRGLQEHHQVDTEDSLAFVHQIPLERYLHPDPELDAALAVLPQEKVIFTNATAEHAWRVLDLVGIRHHFRRVVDLRALGYVNKPDPGAYRRALSLLRVPAEACALVEDSVRNLRPAKALGMATILVGQDGADEEGVDVAIPKLAHLPIALRALDGGGPSAR
ncbi:MAG: pyrimidine 5'-nucleotidase [Anaerolineae bacterium]